MDVAPRALLVGLGGEVGDERGEAIASYLERISGDANFETTFARSELEELLLVSAAPRMTNGAAAVDGRSA